MYAESTLQQMQGAIIYSIGNTVLRYSVKVAFPNRVKSPTGQDAQKHTLFCLKVGEENVQKRFV